MTKHQAKNLSGLGFPLVIMVGVLFVGAANAGNGDAVTHHTWNDAKYCNAKGCYHPDPLGGWGLLPQRTYRLVYNGDPICPAIQKALNDTIESNDSKASPPPKYDSQSGWHELENEGNGNRRTQNPTFSAPMFLQWNFISQFKEKWEGEETLHDLTYPGKRLLQRWQMVPFKNDGVPYLITEWSPATLTSPAIAPPLYPKTWMISAEQLEEHDWSDYKSYENFKTFLRYAANCEGKDCTDDIHNTMIDPLDAIIDGLSFGRSNLPSAATAHEELPKISKDKQTFPALWSHFGRWQSYVQFAKINDRYYIVLVDRVYDLIVVLDGARPVGDDLCYFDSTISNKIAPP